MILGCRVDVAGALEDGAFATDVWLVTATLACTVDVPGALEDWAFVSAEVAKILT